MLLVRKDQSPKSMKELRSFLGICSFLRGYIPKFSFKAQPLFDLLEKPEHFHWGSDQHKAFENLKFYCATAITLSHPKVGKQLCIQTDSSMQGLGARIALFCYRNSRFSGYLGII